MRGGQDPRRGAGLRAPGDRGQHPHGGRSRRLHAGQRHPRHEPAGDRRRPQDRGRCHLHRPGRAGVAALRHRGDLRRRDRRSPVARGAVVPDHQRGMAAPARGLRPLTRSCGSGGYDVRLFQKGATMESLPIGDYALLSDCRSAALVSRSGSVDWLCFPRFDGPSVFARLLDDQAGHWSIEAPGATEVSRRYVEGTMALETTFRTRAGTAVLLDAMAIGRNERGHELGVDSPGIVLRSVSCQSGTVELALEYAPRFEYGLIFPLLRPMEGGILARGGADVLLLSSPVVLSIE